MSALDSKSVLPAGQVETKKFPVVGERSAGGNLDVAEWRLLIEGLVGRPLSLTFEQLMDLPQSKLQADIHCVTGWSQLGMEFTGFTLKRLFESVRVLDHATHVRFEAYSLRHHDTSLPLSVALADTWLIHAVDGAPLSPEHGYPLRTLTPSRYFYKSLKWVHRIELMAADREGYWERESSYHNTGDPWAGDQRFSTGSMAPKEVQRFREATSFDRYRRKVLLGLDLRGWRPRVADLAGIQLKNCALAGAKLADVDLRGANLSLSDFRGADLRRSDLRGADLEGANFAGADLRGACLDEALLTATRFFELDDSDQQYEASIDGISWRGTSGLLESQEQFLLSRS